MKLHEDENRTISMQVNVNELDEEFLVSELKKWFIEHECGMSGFKITVSSLTNDKGRKEK